MDADLRGLIQELCTIPEVVVNPDYDALRRRAAAALSVAQGQGFEHIGWEGRTVWPGVEPAGWWGMANRPDEPPLAHPHTQHRRIYAGPIEPAAPAQPDGVG